MKKRGRVFVERERGGKLFSSFSSCQVGFSISSLDWTQKVKRGSFHQHIGAKQSTNALAQGVWSNKFHQQQNYDQLYQKLPKTILPYVLRYAPERSA